MIIRFFAYEKLNIVSSRTSNIGNTYCSSFLEY